MTTKRSLRLSVPDELYRNIEQYARTLNVPISTAAGFLLAVGTDSMNAYADRKAREKEDGGDS